MKTEQSSRQPAVNFYILPDSDWQNRYFFVFRLVEKAFEQALPTLILTADEQQSQVVDRLLWTANPARFIAHEIIGESSHDPYHAESPSVLPLIVLTHRISEISSVGFSPEVVIDLSYDAQPLDFPKTMLIANQHQEILSNARMKYQSYVNQGIQPEVYKISEKQLALSS